MTQRFFVPGPLPSLNEMIASAKGYNGRGFAYSKMKQEWTDLVVEIVKKAKIKPMDACIVVCEWHEKNKRRDLDGIQAGVKFVLDGLVKANILPNDTQAEVRQILHSVAIDKAKPGVLVELRS